MHWASVPSSNCLPACSMLARLKHRSYRHSQRLPVHSPPLPAKKVRSTPPPLPQVPTST
ncbi:hypothetical protein LZ31DRAFT_552814 [Colletotrichum somersetense]|nr:hypothetical protein LZ31DRAFT_552814 [Colletotrichum somersetense]